MFCVARFKFIASVAVLNGVSALRIKPATDEPFFGCSVKATPKCCTDWKTIPKNQNVLKNNKGDVPEWFLEHCQECKTLSPSDAPHSDENCVTSFVQVPIVSHEQVNHGT